MDCPRSLDTAIHTGRWWRWNPSVMVVEEVYEYQFAWPRLASLCRLCVTIFGKEGGTRQRLPHIAYQQSLPARAPGCPCYWEPNTLIIATQRLRKMACVAWARYRGSYSTVPLRTYVSSSYLDEHHRPHPLRFSRRNKRRRRLLLVLQCLFCVHCIPRSAPSASHVPTALSCTSHRRTYIHNVHGSARACCS